MYSICSIYEVVLYLCLHLLFYGLLSYITSWDLHESVTSSVLLLKSYLHLRTLKKKWKDFLSFLRWAIWTCWRYPAWNNLVHELETSEDSVYKILFLCVCLILCLLHSLPVHFILIMWMHFQVNWQCLQSWSPVPFF